MAEDSSRAFRSQGLLFSHHTVFSILQHRIPLTRLVLFEKGENRWGRPKLAALRGLGVASGIRYVTPLRRKASLRAHESVRFIAHTRDILIFVCVVSAIFAPNKNITPSLTSIMFLIYAKLQVISEVFVS